MLFYMGEAYTADCRATGASLINAISQPGAIVAGIIVTTLLAAGARWSAPPSTSARWAPSSPGS